MHSGAGEFNHFEVVDAGGIDSEAEEGLDRLPALLAGGTGVEGQHLPQGVVLHLEDMAMSADEKINDIYHFFSRFTRTICFAVWGIYHLGMYHLVMYHLGIYHWGIYHWGIYYLVMYHFFSRFTRTIGFAVWGMYHLGIYLDIWGIYLGILQGLFGFETFLKPRDEPGVIMPGVAADMGHKDIDILDAEAVELTEGVTHISAVHIAEDGACGAELPQTLEEFGGADIAGVPYLVAGVEMLEDAGVEQAMCITEEADAGHNLVERCVAHSILVEHQKQVSCVVAVGRRIAGAVCDRDGKPASQRGVIFG